MNKSPFTFAADLIIELGALAQRLLNETYETEWKPDNTPVTSVDTAINDLAIQRISAQFPDDPVYGEEQSRRRQGGSTWVIDPIDGTQALGRLDTYTICLARLDANGRPEFGLVLNPSREELFVGQAGKPATLNNEPIHVSSRARIKSSYIHFGSALRWPELVTNGVAYDRLEAQGAKIFNTRSLAFGAVSVAAGRFDGAIIGVKTPFEAAAVELIVRGAGGRVTDIFGRETSRLDGEIKGLIVSNGLVHDELVAALLP